MQKEEIFRRVQDIFSRVISPGVSLTQETVSRDVREWDSLSHVMFIAELEKDFGIRFELSDMLNMRSIGEICKGIEKQLESK